MEDVNLFDFSSMYPHTLVTVNITTGEVISHKKPFFIRMKWFIRRLFRKEEDNMLTILLVLCAMAIVIVLSLLVAGAIAISPVILLILLFPVLDIIVIGWIIGKRKRDKK